MSSTCSASLTHVEAALCGRLEETLKALQKDPLWRMPTVCASFRSIYNLHGMGVGIALCHRRQDDGSLAEPLPAEASGSARRCKSLS